MSWPAAASAFSVGTANSGVPMKIRRRGMVRQRSSGGQGGLRLFCCAQLRRLGKLLGDAIAFQLRNVVDEQLAIEMIDLMLDTGRKQPGRLLLMGLAIKVGVAKPHCRGPLDLFVIFGDRQAAFLVG